MILYSSLPSTFGRKVKIAAAILGLSDRIEIVLTNTADPADIIRVKIRWAKSRRWFWTMGRLFSIAPSFSNISIISREAGSSCLMMQGDVFAF